MESLFPSRARGGSPTSEDEAPALGGAFGVYDEGGGVMSLYATPITSALLAKALRTLHLGGALIDVTPDRGEVRQISHDRLAELGEPLELVHVPSADEGPKEALSLLAGPHDVLGEGCALGFSLQDRDHGVLYTRDRKVLATVLGIWLADVVDTLAAPSNSPDIPEGTLDSVLTPIPPQAWRRVMLDRHSRFWALDVSAMVNDGVSSEVIDDLTWVGGPGRAWRAGWSW